MKLPPNRFFTAAHRAERRMKIVIAAAAALSLSISNTFATSQDDAFQKVAHDYVEQYLKANPEQATELGDHRFDGELTDYSAEARAKDLATQKEFRDKLNAIDGSQLTGANNIDFRILKENIDYEIFRAEELKEPEWNPLVYMQSLANSLYLLVARDFAPAEKRIPSLRQRLEKIPGVIAQAKANLQHPPRIHTETAIEQTQGAINLVRTELAPLLDQAPQMKKDLAPLQDKTAAALEDYKKWLQNDLLPRSDGDFRLGEAEVQEETALRPGVGFADGRNLETGKGRSGTNTNRHLRNGVAALQKIFSERRSTNSRRQTQSDGRGVGQACGATS